MNRTLSVVFSAAGAVAIVGSARANSIVNGDFEAGNTGFTSAYLYVPPASIYDPARYSIVQYDTIHSSWTDFADHTTGDGNVGHYMIVNGTDAGLGPTWAQDQSLGAGRYELSGWFASLFPNAPASLQFRVVDGNGSIISPTFAAPLPPGQWAQRSFTFDIATAGTYSVQIWDTNDQYTGNDYAIDDIALTVVPLPAAVWTGVPGAIGVFGLTRIRRRRLSRV